MKFKILSLFVACSILQGRAQTEVIHQSEANGKEQGLVYTLPRTVLQIKIISTKKIKKIGKCYQYSERYLGIKSPILQNETEWEIQSIELQPQSLPDENQSFMILFRSTPAPIIDLTSDGVIRSINTPFVEEEAKPIPQAAEEKTEKEITEEDIMKAMTEELLLANSVGKMADLAAKEIYDIRETRNELNQGKLENMPSDGESFKLMLKQLDDRERALSALFLGTTHQEVQTTFVDFYPTEEIDKKVAFRFSKHLGVVEKDNLSGSPFYLSLKIINKSDLVEKNRNNKVKNGIYYRIPAKVSYSLFDIEKHSLASGEVLIPQMGGIQSLSPNLFDKKNPIKVIFDPQTGAIRQLIQ